MHYVYDVSEIVNWCSSDVAVQSCDLINDLINDLLWKGYYIIISD